ncbi:FixH family protein [Halalkalibacterium ligniniphilum]|uniref:FixH family protein n=1 Tax=Halalkalibacterium ligniniphilum TaxID=1134413 RepID=UPI00034B5998|nr:FixH family protein [Halalkalibacterium ligniniphilum]
MKLERSIQLRPYVILFLAIPFVIGSIWASYVIFSPKELVTDWRMEVVGLEEAWESGEATDIHLFLYDENGTGIDSANVQIKFDMPGMVHHMEKTMHHVENGLYETEVIFSMGGTWVGFVEATNGAKVFRNPFIFEVTGPVIAEANRDPQDHFQAETAELE